MKKDVQTVFSGIEDPRVAGRCLHKLSDILFIALCALLANGEDFEDMVNSATKSCNDSANIEARQDLRTPGEALHLGPCDSTAINEQSVGVWQGVRQQGRFVLSGRVVLWISLKEKWLKIFMNGGKIQCLANTAHRQPRHETRLLPIHLNKHKTSEVSPRWLSGSEVSKVPPTYPMSLFKNPS
ncbi:MAG: transposase family protein [Saprospiraceae bacterium]|nr:transposase family protein [Saprospiraceae bacterium]